MYSRQEASQLRKNFWTSFGQYMRPVRSTGAETVNWLNYKTGVKHIYFRMDADKLHARIGIELHHPDNETRSQYFEQLQQLRSILEEVTNEKWEWQSSIMDDDGKTISRISITLKNVNVFDQSQWPQIISFLKPRMVALDEFWWTVKDGFE